MKTWTDIFPPGLDSYSRNLTLHGSKLLENINKQDFLNKALSVSVEYINKIHQHVLCR